MSCRRFTIICSLLCIFSRCVRRLVLLKSSAAFQNIHDCFYLTSFYWKIMGAKHSFRCFDLRARIFSSNHKLKFQNPHDCCDLTCFPGQITYPRASHSSRRVESWFRRANFLVKSQSAVLDSAIWQVFKIFVLIIYAFFLGVSGGWSSWSLEFQNLLSFDECLL